MSVKTKETIRGRIRARIRKKIAGTPERPRLAVFRSQNHIYAQVINDELGGTVCAASSRDKQVRSTFKRGSNLASAKAVGALIASLPPTQAEQTRHRDHPTAGSQANHR